MTLQRRAPLFRALDVALVLAAAKHIANRIDTAVFENEKRGRRDQTSQNAEGKTNEDDDREDQENDKVFAERQPSNGSDDPFHHEPAADPDEQASEEGSWHHVEDEVTEKQRGRSKSGDDQADTAVGRAETGGQERERYRRKSGQTTTGTGGEALQTDGTQLRIEVDIAPPVEFDSRRVHEEPHERDAHNSRQRHQTAGDLRPVDCSNVGKVDRRPQVLPRRERHQPASRVESLPSSFR